MFEYISGKIVEKKTTYTVVDANGIGYYITIPISTYDKLGEVGSVGKLYIRFHVRENEQRLFGFASKEERIVFDSLLKVAGIGPKIAISVENNVCSIGACCTFKEIGNNELIRSHFPVLKMAVEKIGSPQIRNIATIGGNICNLAACADSIAPLLVYDAQVRLRSESSARTVPLDTILIKPYKTDVHHDEILTQILLPLPDKDWKHCFYKLGRRSGVSISRLSYAILLKTREGKIEDIRFAFGALFSVPKRLKDIENELRHQTISADLWKDVSRKIAQKILDETGVRWSTSYKIPTLQQLFFTSLMNLT